MSYQVIARKWRSKNFNELVGQNHIAQTLTNAINSHRLPHAILFTGPRGTGKTSSARILSKILRCPQIKDQIPCNNCDECKTISSGHSINVIEIDGASNNGVEAIRELRESVGYMPVTGKYKVYIIDEVHMLSTSAFNALLKTLEEPPSHVIFILATTEAQKIPNTISSRCQRFDFRRISIAAIHKHLEMICEQENISTNKEALWLIAKQADGSMRDAQSFLDQVISFSNKKITTESTIAVLGLTDRQLISDTIELLVKKDATAFINIIEKLMHSGLDPVIFAKELLEQTRNLLVIKTSPKKFTQIVDLPDSEINFLKELASAISEEDIHLLFDMTLKGTHDLTQSQDPQMVLEMLLARMLKAPKVKDIPQFVSNPTQSKNNDYKATQETQTTGSKVKNFADQLPSQQPSQSSPLNQKVKNFADQLPSQQPSQQPSQSSPLNQNEQKWLSLVKQIKLTNPILATKIENLHFISLVDKNIKIGIPKTMKFLHKDINNPDFQKKLKNYITTFWGDGYNIDINTNSQDSETSSTPKKMKEKVFKFENEIIQKKVEEHPLIKSTKNIFNSHIVSIKDQKNKKTKDSTTKEKS